MEPKDDLHNDTSKSQSRLGSAIAIRWTLAAFLLGLVFEILFYGHRIGISFPILLGMCVLVVLGLALLGRIMPARFELLLVVLILFLSAVVAFRREGMTVFLAVTLSLAAFALWVRVFRSDRLLSFGVIDLIVGIVVVPLESWIRPWSVLGEVQGKVVWKEGGRKRVFAIGRGLLLALPILVILLALLSGADLIFADYVKQVLSWVDLELLVEYYGRFVFIGISALFFLGAIVIALREPSIKPLIGEDKPLLAPFLGFTEALVIILLVDLIFLLFVIIQFVYLFGGEANIAASGYTYSEYARRGFGELVAVAFLSLGLIVFLGMFTRRTATKQKGVFSLLSALLVSMVIIMLLSALKRLLLYENAYGFTRLRTYTHVAIFWMGALFFLFIFLLIKKRLRGFGLAIAFSIIGFAVSLALMNVDGFIVSRNVSRLEKSNEIDLYYLMSLSEDAIPELVEFTGEAPAEIRIELLPQLACRRAQLQDREDGWPAYHFSTANALQALGRIDRMLNPYTAYLDHDGIWKVLIRGEPEHCYNQAWAWFRD